MKFLKQYLNSRQVKLEYISLDVQYSTIKRYKLNNSKDIILSKSRSIVVSETLLQVIESEDGKQISKLF